MDLFRTLEKKLGTLNIIVEDLGFLTPSVRKLVKDSGFPGMKVLQFAFTPGQDSEYLPHNHTKNFVAYPGTHDNTTLADWLQRVATPGERAKAEAYFGLDPAAGLQSEVRGFVRGALASPAFLAVIPLADWLGLGAEGRINQPGVLGGNWGWRAAPGACTGALADAIRALCAVFGRAAPLPQPESAAKPQPAEEQEEPAKEPKPPAKKQRPQPRA